MINDELIHKWVNGVLTAEELEVFKLRPEYDSLVALYKNTDGLKVSDIDDEAMLSEILKTDKKKVIQPDIGKRRFITNWMKYAAAAVVVILAGWWLWPSNGEVIYQMAKGERMEGVLPDESIFNLNAESTLIYQKDKWSSSRNLTLMGEAFFNVKKGSKFIVKTDNGSVEVLGTSFNVLSRKKTLSVECKSGKVLVRSIDGKVSEELNPGQAVRMSPKEDAFRWEVQNSDSWVNGISRFKKVPLSVVIDELERQFDAKISSAKVNTEEVVSCNFQHKDLELALKTTLSPLSIQYEIKSDNVISLYK